MGLIGLRGLMGVWERYCIKLGQNTLYYRPFNFSLTPLLLLFNFPLYYSTLPSNDYMRQDELQVVQNRVR